MKNITNAAAVTLALTVLAAPALAWGRSSGRGIPCGNSYISPDKTCHVGTPSPPSSPPVSPTSGPFHNCSEANAAGRSDLSSTDPDYSPELDRDHDGIACESGGSDDDAAEDTTTTSSDDGLDHTVGPIPDVDADSVQYAAASDLRDLVEVQALGGGRYTLRREGQVLNLRVDDKAARLSTQPYTLVAAPYVKDGKLYLPASALRAFGCTVEPNLPGNALIDCASRILTVDVRPRPASVGNSTALAGTPQAVANSPARPNAPVTPTAPKQLPGCPELRIGADALQYKVPAKFPDPAKFVPDNNDFTCGQYTFRYEQGGPYSLPPKKFNIQAPDWRQAWAFLMTQEIKTYIEPGVDDLVIEGDTVRFVHTLDFTPLNKSIVVALKPPVGNLKPLVFDGKITPQKLGKGVNRIYYRLVYPHDKLSYQMIEIDTIRNTITLVPEAKMPAR